MKKFLNRNKNYLFGIIIYIAALTLSILLFAILVYFLNLPMVYMPLFSNISLGLANFFAAYFIAYKQKSKGFLTGLILALVTFALVSIISLIIDEGSVSLNSLLKFVILALSGVIGGIMGVNKTSKQKYI